MAHNGGLLQANSSSGQLAYSEIIALNLCKQQGFALTPCDGLGNVQTDGVGQAFINDRGYPTRLPVGAGAMWVSNQFWSYGGNGDVLVAEVVNASATVILVAKFSGATFTENIISANIREYTFNGTPTPAGGIRGDICAHHRKPTSPRHQRQIRVYRRLSGGGGFYFDQGYLDGVYGTGRSSTSIRYLAWNTGIGKVRFGNQMEMNSATWVRWSDRNVLTDYSWAAPIKRARLVRVGVITEQIHCGVDGHTGRWSGFCFRCRHALFHHCRPSIGGA
jgi:hypothetical protein